MSASFDAYHHWLGIAPEEQPADHYRLLGLRRFESNADVIDSSADRQMRHVRSFQSGQHVELSQKVLNELSKARLCLLDPDRKRQYDQRLRTAPTLDEPGAKPGAVPMGLPKSDPTVRPAPRPQPGAMPTGFDVGMLAQSSKHGTRHGNFARRPVRRLRLARPDAESLGPGQRRVGED